MQSIIVNQYSCILIHPTPFNSSRVCVISFLWLSLCLSNVAVTFAKSLGKYAAFTATHTHTVGAHTRGTRNTHSHRVSESDCNLAFN